VILIELLVAGEPVAQLELLVIITVTTSPFAKVVLVNIAAFVPAFVPFTCHWYVGVAPPFVGVAVNVIGSPEQMVVVLAAILTLATTLA
jgi:hypothetical protein